MKNIIIVIVLLLFSVHNLNAQIRIGFEAQSNELSVTGESDASIEMSPIFATTSVKNNAAKKAEELGISLTDYESLFWGGKSKSKKPSKNKKRIKAKTGFKINMKDLKQAVLDYENETGEKLGLKLNGIKNTIEDLNNLGFSIFFSSKK